MTASHGELTQNVHPLLVVLSLSLQIVSSGTFLLGFIWNAPNFAPGEHFIVNPFTLATHYPVPPLLTSPSSQNHLYLFLQTWNRHFDADRSGSIEGAELSNALRQFGYNLSPPLLQLVLRKYGEPHYLLLVSQLSLFSHLL